MADEHVHVVVAELTVPAQLLLEGPVLIVIIGTASAAAVALTVADDRAVIALVDAVAQVHVASHREGEVLQEIDLGIGDGVDGVTDGDVLVEFVLPDDVAVGILVAGHDHLAVLVDVGAAVILLVARGIQDVLARVHVVQVHRIDRGDVAAVHERVDVGVRAV